MFTMKNYLPIFMVMNCNLNVGLQKHIVLQNAMLKSSLSIAGYTEEQLESIRYAVAEEMMLDLRDSVQNGRDLDVKDENGATAVSNI